MSLPDHNHHDHQSRDFTYLAVPIAQDVKNTVMSLGTASLWAGAAFEAFSIVSAPVSMIVAATVSTGYTKLLYGYERRTRQMLETGRVNIVEARRPHL